MEEEASRKGRDEENYIRETDNHPDWWSGSREVLVEALDGAPWAEKGELKSARDTIVSGSSPEGGRLFIAFSNSRK